MGLNIAAARKTGKREVDGWVTSMQRAPAVLCRVRIGFAYDGVARGGGQERGHAMRRRKMPRERQRQTSGVCRLKPV